MSKKVPHKPYEPPWKDKIDPADEKDEGKDITKKVEEEARLRMEYERLSSE